MTRTAAFFDLERTPLHASADVLVPVRARNVPRRRVVAAGPARRRTKPVLS